MYKNIKNLKAHIDTKQEAEAAWKLTCESNF